MNDKELIDLMANTWVNNSGDAQGFVWLWDKILKKIREMKE